ncbi:hypothetical protein HDU98_007994 [Podochytrium sp. JEL0797]|nr:hypothetical protein HDU98_007994 [Podochytrium sp. JEL0797]
MNRLIFSCIVWASLTTAAPVASSFRYCHNFLDTTTNSALVYDQIESWMNGTQVWTWDFGSRSQASNQDPNSVAVNPIYYPVYPSGRSAGFPVVDFVPCDDGYSDAWLNITVVVPRQTRYNSITEISSFDPYALAIGKVSEIVNLPIVPKGSTLYGLKTVNIVSGWYKGKAVNLLSLGNVQSTKRRISKLAPYQEVDILDDNSNLLQMVLENAVVGSPNSFYLNHNHYFHYFHHFRHFFNFHHNVDNCEKHNNNVYFYYPDAYHNNVNSNCSRILFKHHYNDSSSKFISWRCV